MIRAIQPAALGGTLRVMPSKSASHRAVLAAALASEPCEVAPLQLSADVEATLRCARALGLLADCALEPLSGAQEGFVRARLRGGGVPASPGLREADCGESGSTLRFFMPLALDGRGPVRLIGHGRLMERPQDVYRALFAAMGARWEDGPGSLTLDGRLQGGRMRLRGDVSSQFVTGLLYALPLCAQDSTLTLTTPLESGAYVALTREMLARFGVRSAWQDERTLFVPGGQRYRSPGRVQVEGDWSHAAFYLVAGATAGAPQGVRLTGLLPDSTQGDRAVVQVLRAMGADIRWADSPDGPALCAYPSRLTGTTIDAAQIPDLVPALCVAACAAQGVTRIVNAGRLRIKECDRLAAMREGLCRMGADVRETPDGLTVQGGARLHGAAVDAWNDHRIAMALCVAAASCEGGTALSGAESVRKSAPAFYREYASLGGMTHALDVGE